jgi:hypothetical protein
MAMVALARAASVMVARQPSGRPSSAAGIAVVDGRVATVLGLWILIVTVPLARGPTASPETPRGSPLASRAPERMDPGWVQRTGPSLPLRVG